MGEVVEVVEVEAELMTTMMMITRIVVAEAMEVLSHRLRQGAVVNLGAENQAIKLLRKKVINIEFLYFAVAGLI